MPATVAAGKRGHATDFALTETEIRDLISYCSDRRTKGMLVLASVGIPVRGIVAFQAALHLHVVNAESWQNFTVDIIGVTEKPVMINPKQYQLLSLFPTGFDVTGVTVWRRIKKVVLAARKDGLITFTDDRVPFPSALMHQAVGVEPSSHQMLIWALQRIHALQARLPNAEFGTPERCPHRDCQKLREWLSKD